ncbi:hypothetical protein F5544_17070 [Nocardia arthritidis]|uniref:RNA-binding S4 domain-containing protein n=1 Tax=Nocardia arthritidis TaxID=228602 RepID=A0A6G9YDT4_9NOCA|nr:hypothetical protein F5544_17070 [Nocardia arthritidis]
MARRARVDAELVRRGLARSREHAVELIGAGRVLINGAVAVKPATAVEAGTPLLVREEPDEVSWASRGAHKLLGALEAFEPRGLTVAGRRCLDAGASTGGFTDVLLSRGAREVVAVDVGYGQLIWRLQNDDRVRVFDRTNVRNLTRTPSMARSNWWSAICRSYRSPWYCPRSRRARRPRRICCRW